MILLNDATITIQEVDGQYTATVSVGSTSRRATAADPVRALGLAVMLKAGYTEGSLIQALTPEDAHARLQDGS